MEQKCVKCGEIFPFTEEYFYFQVQEYSHDYLRRQCKQCMIIYARENEKKCKLKNDFVEYDSKLIRKKRKEMGLTIKQISSKLKMPITTYDAIDRGRYKTVKKENITKILSFLKIDEGITKEVTKHIKDRNKTVEYDNIKIIKARKKRGLTKLEVAARLFIKYRTYEAIEGTEHKRINKKISKVNYKKIYDFFELN